NCISLQTYDEIVITEGVLSGIAVGSNHVALVGKNPTREKIQRLIAAPVSRYIITIEPEALEAMLFLARQLRAAGKEVILWNYEEGDPADSQPAQVAAYNFATEVQLKLQKKR